MIAAELIGADRTIAFLERLPQVAQDAMKVEVSRLAITLLRKVKEEKLSGQVLKNQTGTLRRSINQKVEASWREVVGSVGTNIRYAAAHEFGINKSVTVPAHLRMMKVAWGKAVKNPRKIEIGTHAMKMNLPERSFLRSAMKDMETEIRDGLTSAMQKAVHP